MNVKRFSLAVMGGDSWLSEDADGDYVTFTDYDQLRQRLAEVEADNQRLRGAFDDADETASVHWYGEWVTAKRRAEQAEAKLALAEQDIAALRGFAQAVMECWPEGDVDGGYLQDMAEKHGLLKPEERTIPCGENCGCAEFYMSGEVATCYRGTPLLRGAAINGSRHESLPPHKEGGDG